MYIYIYIYTLSLHNHLWPGECRAAVALISRSSQQQWSQTSVCSFCRNLRAWEFVCQALPGMPGIIRFLTGIPKNHRFNTEMLDDLGGPPILGNLPYYQFWTAHLWDFTDEGVSALIFFDRPDQLLPLCDKWGFANPRCTRLEFPGPYFVPEPIEPMWVAGNVKVKWNLLSSQVKCCSKNSPRRWRTWVILRGCFSCFRGRICGHLEFSFSFLLWLQTDRKKVRIAGRLTRGESVEPHDPFAARCGINRRVLKVNL